MKKDFLKACATIMGTVIGGGILGLPYAFANSGFVAGVINLAILGTSSTLMMLYMGEVVLRTKEDLQFAGLGEKYLGKFGKYGVSIAQIIGIYGALIAYMVGVGTILSSMFGGEPIIYSTIFFTIMAPLVYFGLRTIGTSQLILGFLKTILIVIICLILSRSINIGNIEINVDFFKLLAPYGVVLFAVLGYSVVPEIEFILIKRRELMKKAIVYTMIFCMGIYLIFTFSFVGAFGKNVSEIATNSMNGIPGIFANLFAIFTLSTPLLALGLVLKDMFKYDYKMNNFVSWFFAVVVPYLIILFANPSFVGVLSITGTYAGSIMGIMCCFMVIEARKKGNDVPQYVVPFGKKPIIFLMIVFFGGLVYSIASLIGII